MWIFDSYFKGCVKLWSCERGLERISAAYPPSFFMHLEDPHAYWEMIESFRASPGSKKCCCYAIFLTSLEISTP
jgi:DNA polymerase, archaea type